MCLRLLLLILPVLLTLIIKF